MAAHELAAAHLPESRYVRTRGVAQQAARLARATHLARDARALLLSAAWVHDMGPQREVARRARLAGAERLARIVAHRGFAAMAAAMRDEPPLQGEFPVPVGADEDLLRLLDIACITTDAGGARSTPAAALRALVGEVGGGDPAVRCLVALVTRLGEDPVTRNLTQLVAAGEPGGQATAGGGALGPPGRVTHRL